ncbi:GntR family transcriptional regulator [Roseivivax isoporae]|uniref:Transcriptional regulator n=1 Tax=Roseivivax isoporae LMG 25204 TaxID=1449351 RepID=X7F8B5_9RHOB|nr:GntR family transcriptional regulator [Roseivivax isoporae]ETX28968.1 transcriptional regulator [Roseivivax isoporae LMG 25204]
MTKPAAQSKSERIASLLEAEIRSGQLQDGSALSSENCLVSRFAVSRTTVRKSLGILAEKGLIRTKMGIGSFVTYAGNVIDSGPGWSLALSSAGIRMETRILRIARLGMDLEVPVPLAGEMLAVDRLRFRTETGRGMSLERARVPWRAEFAALLEDGLDGGSLNRTLAARGLVPASGEEWANVLPSLGAEDAALLGLPEATPMLRLRRLTRDTAGQPVEFVESLLDPELFGLHMRF